MEQLEEELADSNVDETFRKSLVDLLTCGRCSTVVTNHGQYERLENAMAEIYHGKGMFKRYKVYVLNLDTMVDDNYSGGAKNE